jgi:NADH:ubiquinone oxidoreductase subunit 6 (subunit J)
MQIIIFYVVVCGLILIFNVYFYASFSDSFYIYSNVETLFLSYYNNNLLDIYYLGELLYQSYDLCLFFIGVLLLVAIIGVIYLTTQKSIFSQVKTITKIQNISLQGVRYTSNNINV